MTTLEILKTDNRRGQLLSLLHDDASEALHYFEETPVKAAS